MRWAASTSRFSIRFLRVGTTCPRMSAWLRPVEGAEPRTRSPRSPRRRRSEPAWRSARVGRPSRLPAGRTTVGVSSKRELATFLDPNSVGTIELTTHDRRAARTAEACSVCCHCSPNAAWTTVECRLARASASRSPNDVAMASSSSLEQMAVPVKRDVDRGMSHPGLMAWGWAPLGDRQGDAAVSKVMKSARHAGGSLRSGEVIVPEARRRDRMAGRVREDQTVRPGRGEPLQVEGQHVGVHVGIVIDRTDVGVLGSCAPTRSSRVG